MKSFLWVILSVLKLYHSIWSVAALAFLLNNISSFCFLNITTFKSPFSITAVDKSAAVFKNKYHANPFILGPPKQLLLHPFFIYILYLSYYLIVIGFLFILKNRLDNHNRNISYLFKAVTTDDNKQ